MRTAELFFNSEFGMRNAELFFNSEFGIRNAELFFNSELRFHSGNALPSAIITNYEFRIPH